MSDQLITTDHWRVEIFENESGELAIFIGAIDGTEIIPQPTDSTYENALGTLAQFYTTEAIEAKYAVAAGIPMYYYTSLSDDNALFVAYGTDIDGHSDTEDVIVERLALHLDAAAHKLAPKLPTRQYVRNFLNASLLSLNQTDRDILREATIEYWIDHYGRSY